MPTVEQDALVSLAMAHSYLEEEVAEKRAEIRQQAEEHHDHVLRLRMQGATYFRAPRPYEGSLWRELRHAYVRWRSYRR